MKRATWKGAITLGDISVPVSMYTCVTPKEVKLHSIHSKCRTKIKQDAVCPNCQQTVSKQDIVKGVEITPNSYLLLSEEEITSVQPKRNNSIEVLSFTKLMNLKEVDQMYVHSCYYLLPEESNSGPYVALVAALQKTKMGIVATVTMRTKQRVVLLYPTNEGIIRVMALHYVDDINIDAIAPVYVKSTGVIDKKTMSSLTTFIKKNSAGFDPNMLRNAAEKKLSDLINKRLYDEGWTALIRPRPEGVVQVAAFTKAIQNATLKKQEQDDEDSDIPMLKYKRAL